MSAFLIVRAEVPKSERDAFDHWYETEHLPDAHRAFNSLSARRGWSSLNPLHHLAFYEFPDRATADAISNSDAIRELIAEFDRCWEDRVTRTRDVVEIAQSI